MFLIVVKPFLYLCIDNYCYVVKYYVEYTTQVFTTPSVV